MPKGTKKIGGVMWAVRISAEYCKRGFFFACGNFRFFRNYGITPPPPPPRGNNTLITLLRELHWIVKITPTRTVWSIFSKLSFSLYVLLLPWMNVMLDFICMGPVELRGAWNKRKLQNEKTLSIVEFEPTPGTVLILRVYRLNPYSQISIVVNK